MCEADEFDSVRAEHGRRVGAGDFQKGTHACGYCCYDQRGNGRKRGGATRSESVANGLHAIADRVADDDWILVHDAARPCIDAALLARLAAAIGDDPVGGLLAMPVSDTLKRAQDIDLADARVERTEDRHGLWCAQTPQMFRYALLRTALERARGSTVTDDAQAIEALGKRPRLVRGSASNVKITYADDLALAEAWFAHRVTP